jgi:hypothetical protein
MKISNVKKRIKRNKIRFQLWKYIKKFIYDNIRLDEEILNENGNNNSRCEM